MIYTLDGVAGFDEFVAGAGGEEPIIVGLGSGLAPDERRSPRPRDFKHTPVRGLAGPGGGSNFLHFVEASSKPAKYDRSRIVQGRGVTTDHSVGGLLALFVLFSYPSLFDAYIALSPSVTMDYSSGLSSESEPPDDGTAHLLVATGGKDDQAPMIAPVERFIEFPRSDSLKGARLSKVFRVQEDRLSVAPPLLAWAGRGACVR